MNILPLYQKTSNAENRKKIHQHLKSMISFLTIYYSSINLAAPIPSKSQNTGVTIGRLRFTKA